jgi:hypothetical protein
VRVTLCSQTCRKWFEGLVDDEADKEHPEDVPQDATKDTRTVEEDVQGNPIHLDELRRQVGEHADALLASQHSGIVGQSLAGAALCPCMLCLMNIICRGPHAWR